MSPRLGLGGEAELTLPSLSRQGDRPSSMSSRRGAIDERSAGNSFAGRFDYVRSHTHSHAMDHVVDRGVRRSMSARAVTAQLLAARFSVSSTGSENGMDGALHQYCRLDTRHRGR